MLMIVSISVYTIIGSRTKTYLPISIVSVIIGIAAFTILDYPWIISGLIMLFFGWRFISHEREADQQHLFLILVVTLLLMMGAVFASPSFTFFFMGILQFVLLIGFSIIQSQWHNGKNLNKKGVLQQLALFGSISAVIVLAFWAVYPVLQFIYQIVGIVLARIGGIGIGVLDRFVDLEIKEETGQNKSNLLEIGKQAEKMNMADDPEVYQDGNAVELMLIILILLATIALIFVGIKLARTLVEKETISKLTVSSHVSNFDEQQSHIAKSTYRTAKPNNRIRREFYMFELFCHKKGYGRKRGETIEEWFARIELPIDKIKAYFLVRYKNQIISDDEIKKFNYNIRGLRSTLQDRQKHRVN